jgi:hypothetical protein
MAGAKNLITWGGDTHCKSGRNIGVWLMLTAAFRFTLYVLNTVIALKFLLISLTRGALTFSIFVYRFFVFDVQESSKFLVAQGRDEEAIKVARQYY